MATPPKKLGRGLSALFGEADASPPPSRTVPVEHLRPGRYQPRRHFDDEAMTALTESIRQQGVLQPLLVRADPERADRFEIVAGERRWRAAQAAQLHEVPVVVRSLDDRQALEIALVENVQRQDLSAIEEAEGYQRLIGEFGHTQEQLSQAVGKSRSHVANALRLLTLPVPVQAMLRDGRLTAGHARTLVGAADPERLAARMIDDGLSVRAAERLVQREKAAPRSASRAPAGAPPAPSGDLAALARDLETVLGLKVQIDFDGTRGRVVVDCSNLEQLDDVVQRLSRAPG